MSKRASTPAKTCRKSPAGLVHLGKVIRELRVAKHLSQGQLAVSAEMDRSYLARVERGTCRVTILTLVRIAKALRISVASMLRKAKL
jgi:transcriptional regulator with XRE-family HTH domain